MWFGNLINFNIESRYHIILSSRNSFSIVITQLYFSISIAPIEHIINYPIFSFHLLYNYTIVLFSSCVTNKTVIKYFELSVNAQDS